MSVYDTFQPISREIWERKYRFVSVEYDVHEGTPEQTLRRVADAIYADDNREHRDAGEEAMAEALWIPGGRILAGAGTPKMVTLVNCFMMDDVPDDLAGIFRVLTESALTMQQGGGIGMDFSKIRPRGSPVKGVGADASGPISFMGVWDEMCKTIMSAGERRGAMMGLLRCDHPNVPDFIEAKRTAGQLTQFNVSVAVTDAFMEAVRDDGSWDLGFRLPSLEREPVEVQERDGDPWYVYRRLPARELWDLILRNTYEYAEPGVVFIDRINEVNNLSYCETINGCNPCAEQPLPPYGDCNLGAVNLARMVRDPWTDQATVDFDEIERVVGIGMRFLDNVIDATGYPLARQEEEAKAKRRTGLGVMGLANLLQQRKLRYGSLEAVALTERIMVSVAAVAYQASVELARERGSFPLFDPVQFCERPFIKGLPRGLQIEIEGVGIRNGVLLTIAPTGTTAIFAGNVSGGVEPVFAHRYTRNVLQADGSTEPQTVMDWGWLEYCRFHDLDPEQHHVDLPEYMVTTADLTVDDHIAIQAAAQGFIDASISKTINCPASMSFDDFGDVYLKAYDAGLKSCTTYRPSGVRGAVLEVEENEQQLEASGSIVEASGHQLKASQPVLAPDLPAVPEVLPATRYKITPPDHSVYVTIADIGEAADRRPFELFITTKHAAHKEWCELVGRLVSAIFRRGGDTAFVADEFQQVFSASGGFWMNGRQYASVSQAIGGVIKRHMAGLGLVAGPDLGMPAADPPLAGHDLELCPKCQQRALVHTGGCATCRDCGWSNCG